MRESEKVVSPTRDAYAVFKNFLESPMENPFVRNAWTISDRLSILIAKLNSHEVFVMIWILSEHAVVTFRLRSVEVDTSRSDFDSMDDGHNFPRSLFLVQ